MITTVTWQTPGDAEPPTECVMGTRDGRSWRYVRSDLAAERALKAGQDGYRLAEERAAEQLRDVVTIARSLKRCTTFTQVHDLADRLIVRFGPRSESPTSDGGGA